MLEYSALLNIKNMYNLVFCNNGSTYAEIIYFRAYIPIIWTLLTIGSVRPSSEFWILEHLFGQPGHHMVTPPGSTPLVRYLVFDSFDVI